jgi:cell wall-associated NlpC family hydrolase
MKPAYRAAVDEARAKGVYVGGDPGYEGIDCGGFISLVMRNSGADPNYNEYKGPTSDQERYMKDHPEKYQALGSQNDTSALQPGDIAITSNHTYMYVGSKGFPGYNSVSASLDSRVPMASGADFIDSKGISFNWYRLIK